VYLCERTLVTGNLLKTYITGGILFRVMRTPKSATAVLIKVFGVWAFIVYSVVYILTLNDPVSHAVMGMAGGLAVLWIVIGGATMFKVRDRVKSFVRGISWGWKKKFVLFATVLALTEEAIATTMTNLAPLFGVEIGEAYITASTNYLDVVLFHSAIVFIPMFVAWAFLLSRYDFSPTEVFILFGLTGVLAEAGSFGLQNLGSAGFWVFVYGLMVYLPAYSIPERDVKKPRLRHYFLAIFLPFIFVIPVAFVVHLVHPTQIHFES